MLPEEAVTEFQKLCLDVLGIELNEQEATFRANRLIQLYKATYYEDLTSKEINK